MSKRIGVTTRFELPIEPIPAPNNYRPFVTAEVRIHWPPNATLEEINYVVSSVVGLARDRVLHLRGEPADERNG